MEVEVIYDDSPMLEREDRPRSRTWPILPPPCETIHENECDAEIAQRPPIIEESQVEEEEEKKTEGQNTRKNARKNAWGNLSYADLITQAIQASPESRLTLSQIYEWMVRNIPYFKDKGDSTSSAGWKNSIRHNLSLHSRFMRVQNDNNGKSSYWVINPDAKPGKSSRRRAGSVDGQPKDKSKRARNKKMYQSTDDMTSLSPVNMKFKQNRSYDNLFAVSSPCSSTDSLSNMGDGEFHPDVCSPYGAGGAEVVCSTYTGESFNRPRSTSNVSLQSNVGCDQQLDDDLMRLEQHQIICQEDNGANDLIGGRFNFGSIKLEDGLKVPEQKGFGQHDKLSVPKTGNSDSFGSSDSGYESPAYFSPPQKNPNNQMQTIGNHTGVRPPPPYTQSYGTLNYPPQNGFYAQPPPQTCPSFMMNPASPQNNVPRLKHLSYGQPSYQTTPSLSMHKQYSRHNNVANNRNLIGTPNRVYDGMCQQPQKTIQNGMPCHTTQIKTESNNNIIDSMPSDLDQVKLFGFDDQQQLALDLNQIIENDLKGQSQSLQSLCEPMMNSNGPTTTSSFTYQQSWVR